MSTLTPYGVYKIRDQISYITNGSIAEYKVAIEASAERGVNEGNDEYFTLLHESKKFENQVSELLKILNESEVLDPPPDNGKIQLGMDVKIRDEDSGQVTEITIVPESEVVYYRNGVTLSSPMGESLIGLTVGDVAEFETPARSRTLEVLSVQVSKICF